MTHIQIVVPSLGWHRRELTKKCLEIGSKANSQGYDLTYSFPEDKPIDHNRNMAIKNFLQSDNNYDYLLFIDSDNPPIKNPLDLVKLDKDIMILPTPIWQAQGPDMALGKKATYFNIMHYVPEHEGWTEYRPQTGLQEVDAGGSGCMLIARRVLEKLKPAFIREWDEWGCVEKGSDYLFCKRAKEMGFEVWAHFDYFCSHIKEFDCLAVYKYMYIRDIQHAELPNINTPEYWDEQWSIRPKRILPQYEKICSLVNGHRVLDFGCGRGDLLEMLGKGAVGMDISKTAVKKCNDRGLAATQGGVDDLCENYDIIICTEVLEHIDDDRVVMNKLLEHADTLIYSVPFNCMPPGMEPEHRRVYTIDHIRDITPDLKWIEQVDNYLLILAGKELKT